MFQVFPIHVVLHHEVVRSLVEVIGDVGDQWVIQVSECDDFTFEVALIFFKFGGVPVIGDEFFDYDGLVVEALIGCQHGCSHAALAQNLCDDVAASLQGGADGEGAGSAAAATRGSTYCYGTGG